MYTKFFGLSRRPFEERADPQFYFPTPHGDEVLAALEYESQCGQSIALLIGEAGTGKTLLIRSLLMHGKPTDQSVVLTWTAEGQTSVIREACKAFGVTLPSSFSTGRGLARLRRHLNRVTPKGRRALLVIDQAENLSREHLAEISALTSLHLGDHSMLTIMLAGQPRIKSLLDRTELSSLRQRLFGERVLAPFTRAETEAYIAHRVKVAGAANADLFEKTAIDLIHRVSGGIPRLINRLAGEAMLSAYGASCKTVTESVVSELVQENAYEDPMPTTSTNVKAAAVDFEAEVPTIAESGSRVLSSASTSRDSLEFEDASLIEEEELETDRAVGVGYEAGSQTFIEPPADAGFESLNPPEGGGRGGMMLDQGHLLLEKLERAIARAERMNSTSQAALTQSTAVETHLETLVGHAERIAGELGGSVTRANDSLSSMTAKIRTEISTTQSRMAATEERIAAIPEVLEQADHRLAHLQHACANAEQVESSLRQFGEQLADQVDTVQERIGIAVAGTQAGQEALNRATNLIETVQREEASHEQSSRRAAERVDAKLRALDQSLSKADRAVESLHGQTSKMASEAERIKEDLLHKSIDQFQETLQKEVDRCTASQREALNAAKHASDQAIAKTDRAIESLHGRVDKMASEAERIKEDLLHKSIDQFEETLQKALDRFAASQLEALDALESRETELRSETRVFEERIEGLQRTLRAAGQEIDATLKKSTTVATECKKSLAQVVSQEQRVTQISRDLNNSIERGEAHKTDIERVTGNAEELQRCVGAILADVGAAHERAVSARAQFDGYKDIVSEIQQAVQRGQSATRNLDEIASHVDQLQGEIATVAQEASAKTEAFRSGVDQVERKAEVMITRIAQVASEQTEQVRSDIAKVAEEASAKTEAFRSGVDQVEREAEAMITRIAQVASEQTEQMRSDIAKVAEEASATTEAFRSGVRNVHGEADETIAKMAQAVAQGSDAIGSVSVEAQTKVTQLDSHNAAARVVLQELSEMNKKGHGLLDEATTVLEDLGDKTKQVASTIESLWGLASGAEVQTKALASKQQEVESMASRLAGEVQGAQAVLGKLSEQTSGADAQSQIIASRCQDAKKIADRLISISKLLKTAKESEQSITEMVDGARRVADDLSSAAGASHQLLNQFSRQGEGISASISELEKRTGRIESTIEAASEKPAELVRAAKVQTAQLERVCGAVRKVFASLSKTTLEARKQTDMCGKISTNATQQIRNLRAETERSSKTLREWIAEAIRVQTRLERSLDQAPSIRQTHPIEELTHISDRMSVGDAIPEPLTGGELTMLREPEGAGASDWAIGAVPPESESTSSEPGEGPENRADEISRLLADAKNLVPQPPN